MNIPQLQIVNAEGLPPDIRDIWNDLYYTWNSKLERNILRTEYYNGQNKLKNLKIAIPPSLENIEEVVGWPQKAVDALANRIVFDGFVTTGTDRDPFGLDAILDENDFTVELPQAIRSALMHSCSFMYTRDGNADEGEPKVVISFRSAMYASGIWDYSHRRLKSAMIIQDVMKPDSMSESPLIPTDVMIYVPGRTIRILRNDNGTYTPHISGYTEGAWFSDHIPVYPLTYHRDLDRPFGRSRISRAVMSITDAAMRTMLRMEIGAEFYSSPRAALIGAEPPTDKNGKPLTGWDAAISHLIAIDRDENGDMPTLQQLSQMSMQPHSEMLRTLAARMSGETGIPMAQFGVMTDSGPSSADAIAAGESDLCIEAENTCQAMGTQLRKLALDAVVLSGETPDESKAHALQVNWRNPERPSQAAVSDAVTKQIQVIPWLAESDVILERLGYTDSEITRLMSAKRRSEANNTVRSLMSASTEANGDDQSGSRNTGRQPTDGGKNGDTRNAVALADDTEPQSGMAAGSAAGRNPQTGGQVRKRRGGSRGRMVRGDTQ